MKICYDCATEFGSAIPKKFTSKLGKCDWCKDSLLVADAKLFFKDHEQITNSRKRHDNNDRQDQGGKSYTTLFSRL